MAQSKIRSLFVVGALALPLCLTSAVSRADNAAQNAGNTMEKKGNAEEKAANAEKAKGAAMERKGKAMEEAGEPTAHRPLRSDGFSSHRSRPLSYPLIAVQAWTQSL